MKISIIKNKLEQVKATAFQKVQDVTNDVKSALQIPEVQVFAIEAAVVVLSVGFVLWYDKRNSSNSIDFLVTVDQETGVLTLVPVVQTVVEEISKQ